LPDLRSEVGLNRASVSALLSAIPTVAYYPLAGDHVLLQVRLLVEDAIRSLVAAFIITSASLVGAADALGRG
jgi:hypothetical protein